MGQLFLLVAAANALLGLLFAKRWINLHTTTIFIIAAFLGLIYGHVSDDFSLINVFLHSHTAKPLLYKIAGAWGNHEGSFLLWLTLLAICLSTAYRLHQNALFATMGQVILLAFISFILLSCDPFTQHLIIPMEGRDLNPLLQDPLLAIHPPCLYLGYVSLAIPFIWSLTGALTGDMPLKLIRQWSLWGWTFLTLGIALGAFWAYYELGWGGWWAWDPVENVALIPWLSATTQIHLLWLAQKRPSYTKTALVVLSITWASCLAGTIMVRSGLLTSVHTFAVDPERGSFLTIIATALMGAGALILKPYFRSHHLPMAKSPLFLMIEGGCALLMVGWFTVLLGTFYPLLSEFFGLTITVGAPYFHVTFVPIMLPLVILMAYVPDILSPKPMIPIGLIGGGFVLIFAYWLGGITHILSLLTLAGGTWLLVASLKAVGERGFIKPMDIGHGGFAVTLIGMTLTLNLSQDLLTVLKVDHPLTFASYEMELKTVTIVEGPNYTAHQASIDIRHHGQKITTLKPEKRLYHAKKMIHGESALFSDGWHHLYAVLGDAYQDNQWSIRLYVKPWINMMILGVGMMVISGFLALRQRRQSALKEALATILLLFSFVPSSLALEAHEQLDNPHLEQVARELGDLLLCPTCAGQTLNDSPSLNAQELRAHIRRELLAGQSREQIIGNFQDKFGIHVYRHPPLQKATIALWGLPWLVLGGLIFWFVRRNRQKFIG